MASYSYQFMHFHIATPIDVCPRSPLRFVAFPVAVFLALVATALTSQAQIIQVSSVIDAGGGFATNGTHQSLMAIGQGDLVASLGNLSHLDHAGFLNTFLLHPNLDADADGIPDENDPDDDNDSLSDYAELTGAAFIPPTPTDPFNPDSDGDGASDGNEARARTNPKDPGSVFRIGSVDMAGDEITLGWSSIPGVWYEILSAPDPGRATGPWPGPSPRTLSPTPRISPLRIRHPLSLSFGWPTEPLRFHVSTQLPNRTNHANHAH